METIIEWCPECDKEVSLKNEFVIQQCPNCGKKILPCSICDIDNPFKCSKCPFEEYN